MNKRDQLREDLNLPASEEEFWKFVEWVGWKGFKKGYKVNKEKKRILKKYGKKKALRLYQRYTILYDQLNKRCNVVFGGMVRDSRWDAQAHTIGLGKEEYYKTMKDPTIVYDRYKKYDYLENFCYILPSEADYNRKDTTNGKEKEADE